MGTDLPKDELDRILQEKIIPDVIGRVAPREIKEAFILGGQPGSGKSTLAREILKSPNVVFINGDDLRPYHPYYYYFLQNDDQEAADMTQAVCNSWVEELIKECARRGLSLIVEGTLRTMEAPLSTARLLADANYSVNLAVVSAPYDLSLISLKYRYSELKQLGLAARYTKKSSHDESFRKMPDTMSALLENKNLFKKIFIYLRTSSGFRIEAFDPSQADELMKVFNAGRTRQLDEKEKELLQNTPRELARIPIR